MKVAVALRAVVETQIGVNVGLRNGVGREKGKWGGSEVHFDFIDGTSGAREWTRWQVCEAEKSELEDYLRIGE